VPHAPEAGSDGRRLDDQIVRLARDVLGCLIKDFEDHGADAVARLRESDPKTYLAMITRLIPGASRDGDGGLVVRTVIDLGGGDG
jgi:hypothetical protein